MLRCSHCNCEVQVNGLYVDQHVQQGFPVEAALAGGWPPVAPQRAEQHWENRRSYQAQRPNRNTTQDRRPYHRRENTYRRPDYRDRRRYESSRSTREEPKRREEPAKSETGRTVVEEGEDGDEEE